MSRHKPRPARLRWVHLSAPRRFQHIVQRNCLNTRSATFRRRCIGRDNHTWTPVVADGEESWDTSARSSERGAVFLSGGVATDVGSGLPDDLSEMAPKLEVGHVRFVAVEVIERLLSIVEHIGDDSGDVGSLNTGCDVLAVSATPDGSASMLVHANV